MLIAILVPLGLGILLYGFALGLAALARRATLMAGTCASPSLYSPGRPLDYGLFSRSERGKMIVA